MKMDKRPTRKEDEQIKKENSLANWSKVIVRHSEDASASNRNLLVMTEKEHKELHSHKLP